MSTTGPDVATALAAINAVISTDEPATECPMCSQPLTVDSPSSQFCSEDCQTAWLTAQTDGHPIDHGQQPNQARPEQTPAQPPTWLAPAPPPGTVVQPGHEVLDQVAGFISRFSAFPSEHCAPTLALWYAHTHMADRFYVTPRLVLDSAEPGSGKTRVLEVAELFVAAPEMTISPTPSALFRMVAAGPITILFDEVDTVFSQSGNDDLRGLLNAGYKAGATIPRCVGDTKSMKVQRFPVFAPAVLAGVAGTMPATISTRAITIHMRKRRSSQHVDPFGGRTAAQEAKPIRDALANWISNVADQIATAVPDMPDGVTDRPAEIWEPLLAIADAAGGHWPRTARNACTHFVFDPTHTEGISDGIRLLTDLRTLFTHHTTDRLPSIQLVTELRALDESPWGDPDSQLTARKLARELARFSIRPVTFKNPDQTTTKGYVTYPTDRQVGLADAWDRYLLPAPPLGNCGNPGNTAGQPVSDHPTVTDPPVTNTG